MNIRRVVLDVDKVLDRPSSIDLAEVIAQVPGVEGAYLLVDAIDVETMGLIVTVEGEAIDLEALTAALEMVSCAVVWLARSAT